jgi:hypothetical protein
MSRIPRRYHGNIVLSETQRTVDRQFLFKPDEVVKNIIGSSAGRALKLHPVKIYWLDFNINHKHIGRAPLSDSPKDLENLVMFDQMFNSLVARGINKLIDREGAVFSSRNRSAEVLDNESLESQLLYAVTNPVTDGLVQKTSHWKGVSSYKQLSTGEVDTYTYINWTVWHREGGVLNTKPPGEYLEKVKVKLSPLPSWEKYSSHKRQSMFRRLVRNHEQLLRKKNRQEGRRVMGSGHLRKLDYRERPLKKKEKTAQPMCHASRYDRKKEHEQEMREYRQAYMKASALYRMGFYETEFPEGSFRPPLLKIVVPQRM